MSPEEEDVILSVRDLKVTYPSSGRLSPPNVAVNEVSFNLRKGKTLGVIGESGSGKSTLCRAVLRLMPTESGQIVLNGKDITHASGSELKRLRRNFQVVFQDPFSSLDPRWTALRIVMEPLNIHRVMSKKAAKRHALQLLEKVGISSEQGQRLPHQFSGGQRQRIAIARALALEPSLILLDEPLSALDVSVQAQIMNLLTKLQRELDLTYLMVAHDMAVVKRLSDDVLVMFRGEAVESGTADNVFNNPSHAYTKALLAATPSMRRVDA